MEIHAYGHSVEDERRLGEHRRHCPGIEEELVVQCPVVGKPSVLETYPLAAGPVRYDFKFYFLSGHDSDLELRLCPGQFPDYLFLGLPINGHLGKHFTDQLRIDFGKVIRLRNNEKASHVGASGTHCKMVVAFGKIMMGAVPFTGHKHCPVFPETAVGYA